MKILARVLFGLAAAGAIAWAVSIHYPPEPVIEMPIPFSLAPRSNTGDNDLRRQEYARKALEQHLEQIRSGLLERIKEGRACWCCKGPHPWDWCASNPRNFGCRFPEVSP